MKKSLLVISVILLIAGLFISCNSEAAESSNSLVEVKFADDNSKALSSSITASPSESLPPINDQYWWYRATKTTAGGNTGAQSTWTRVHENKGLAGTVGKFSRGGWRFDLIAVNSNEDPKSWSAIPDYDASTQTWSNTDNLVYWGSAGATLDKDAKTVTVGLYRDTPVVETGTVRLYNVLLLNNAIEDEDSTWSYQVLLDETDVTSSVSATHTIDMSEAGEKRIASDSAVTLSDDVSPEAHTVYIYVYDSANPGENDEPVYSATKEIMMYPGLEITVTGSLEEGLSGDVSFEGDTSHIQPTPYSTIFEAMVNAAKTGDTVVLADNVTYGTDHEVAVWEKAFNLDLGGNTFTTNSEVDITLGNMGHKASAICYGESASILPERSITVKNGTIETAYGAGIYADGMNLTLTIDGVTINAAQTGIQTTKEYSSAIRTTSKANVIVKSGNFNAGNGGYAVVVSNSGGNVTINGGTFSAPLFFSNGGSKSTNNITITDGEFTNFAVYQGDTNVTSSSSGLTKGTLVITGGEFDADPSAYVDTDNYNVSHSGSTWTVSANN